MSFEQITFYSANIKDEKDYDILMALSYADEIKRNIGDYSKEKVIGYCVVLDADGPFSLGFIPSKVREAIDKGLTVVIQKGIGS